MSEPICKNIHWALNLGSMPFIHYTTHVLYIYIHCAIHMLQLKNLKKNNKTQKSCENQQATYKHLKQWVRTIREEKITFCFKRQRRNERKYPFVFLMLSPTLTHSMIPCWPQPLGHLPTLQHFSSCGFPWSLWDCIFVWTTLSQEYPLIPVTCMVGYPAILPGPELLRMTKSVVKTWEKHVDFSGSFLQNKGIISPLWPLGCQLKNSIFSSSQWWWDLGVRLMPTWPKGLTS